ncbi:EP1-like glycoprotein 2 [Rosa chinensis]|uniref:EP1-like glycoprotein 2 n=1 Tax=Rosa chinensis TaxID=74649 RepID=UPI000D08EF1E|nr:EP1-like glycoprotein 2 [Rosa chinensis]
MATLVSHAPFLLVLFLLGSFYVIPSQAQVPANQTFIFVNQGKLGDRIVEFEASYRVIQTKAHTFYTHPFRLCFYNTTPDSYIFAIRAGVPNDEDLMRWVWDANRNHPVHEKATLSLGRDGNLILAEADRTVAWQTNTANKGVTGIKLLPDGNLVLHDKNGRFIWQSFDYPHDTLLLGQSVQNITGHNKLISRKSDTDGSDGPYSLILDRSGFTMYLNNSGQLLTYGGWTDSNFGSTVTFDYQTTNGFDDVMAYELVLNVNQDIDAPPQNRRRLLQTRPIGNAHQINLNKLNYDAKYSFLRLGSDGSLKAYTYYNKVSNQKWDESFSFFSSYFVRECALPSKCGSYGYCSNGMCVACPSPKGLLGWSKACAPPKLAASKSGAKVDYYKIVAVEHFLSPYLDGGDGPMKVEECRAKCDNDCKCLGFFYREASSKCLLAPVLGTLIKEVNTSVGYIKY